MASSQGERKRQPMNILKTKWKSWVARVCELLLYYFILQMEGKTHIYIIVLCLDLVTFRTQDLLPDPMHLPSPQWRMMMMMI